MSFPKPPGRKTWLLAVFYVLGWLALRQLAQDLAPASRVRAWESESVGVQGATATLSLPQVTVAPSEQVTVTLTLALEEGQVYSVDIVLTYGPAVVTAVRVERGALAAGWSLASNLETPGVVRIALARATPIETGGELLLFAFDAVGPAGSGTDLTLTRGDLNEGGIPTTLEHGYLSVQLFGDLDGDGDVDIDDIMLVASRWRMTQTDPDWDARYDLDGDGIITVVDIMKVVAHWGETCP